MFEEGIGAGIYTDDNAFEKLGLNAASRNDCLSKANLIITLQPLSNDELDLVAKGSTILGTVNPFYNQEHIDECKKRGINLVSMEFIPRITRAQKMDVLSSQANLAGYKSVILGGVEMGKIFPMLMTSAGTIKPATVVIFGAGVAGLQAIATAKRLGANVWVSDIRPETKEQVASLGGKFIEVGELDNVTTEGGYVKDVSDDFLKKQKEAVLEKVIQADLVITTALVPGKKAPLLISDDMVSQMKPGSVIVDMAVSQGGNCELSELNKVVKKHNVKIVGEGNLPATLPINASELFAKNIQNFVQHLTEDGKLKWDLEDEITAGSLILKNGDVFQESLKKVFQTEAV